MYTQIFLQNKQDDFKQISKATSQDTQDLVGPQKTSFNSYQLLKASDIIATVDRQNKQ